MLTAKRAARSCAGGLGADRPGSLHDGVVEQDRSTWSRGNLAHPAWGFEDPPVLVWVVGDDAAAGSGAVAGRRNGVGQTRSVLIVPRSRMAVISASVAAW